MKPETQAAIDNIMELHKNSDNITRSLILVAIDIIKFVDTLGGEQWWIDNVYTPQLCQESAGKLLKKVGCTVLETNETLLNIGFGRAFYWMTEIVSAIFICPNKIDAKISRHIEWNKK